MIRVWQGLTVVSSLVLFGILLMLLYMYRKDNSNTKFVKLFQLFGFLLIFIQTIVIFLPIEITYANQVTTFKVVSLMFGYLLIATSFLFEILAMKPTKKKRPKKK